MEWQPIETAPKDGAFLVYFDSGDPLREMHYDVCTRWGLSSTNNFPLGVPTHWMPLPPPPQE